jgi:uncharacterized phage infection (PIP) family protein YhgE
MKKEKLFEIKSWRDDARSGLDREKDLISKRCNEVNAYDRLLDALDEVLEEVDDLIEKVDRKQQEVDDLTEQLEQMDAEIARVREQKDAEIARVREQLLEVKELKLALETQLSELSKLSAGVAKKSSQDDFITATRSYLNVSKRKTQSKREAAKMVFMELFSSVRVELPKDIKELLEHLDDEQTEGKVVNVTGNYNDIHDNSSVGMNETKE